jgi:hypothetical protein
MIACTDRVLRSFDAMGELNSAVLASAMNDEGRMK